MMKLAAGVLWDVYVAENGFDLSAVDRGVAARVARLPQPTRPSHT